MKKNYVILTICLLMTSVVFSQTSTNFCGFDQTRTEQMKNPAFAKQAQLFENQLQEKIKQNQLSKRTEDIIQIPVVFHVLHIGEPVGTGSNISDAEINLALNRLTDYYRGRNSLNPEDFNIDFVMAKRDPQCNSINGIIRHDLSGNQDYVDHGIKAFLNDGMTQTDMIAMGWHGREYMNIYLVHKYDSGNSGLRGTGILYNDFEGNGVSMLTSEIVIPASTVFAHETGHYLNLLHPHEGDGLDWLTGVATQCPTDTNNDFVADTVPYRSDNESLTGGNTINFCTGQPWIDNLTSHNLMSYLPTPELLSPGQKARVRVIFEGSNIANSLAKHSPDGSFVAPITAICVPGQPTNPSGQVGIVKVAINGRNIVSQSSYGDGIINNFTDYNIDDSNNCNSFFTINDSSSSSVTVDFPENAPSSFLHQLGVWIDWNNDGDFDDENEQQYLEDNLDPASSVQIPIVYPNTVPYNSYVRIRLIADIRSNWNPNGVIDSACFSPREGQSEDYTIYIEPETLSAEEFGFENINIFSDTKNKQIQIEGNLDTPTKVFLYDIQGRVLVSKKLNINVSNNFINTNSLSSGIYFIKINSGQKNKSKKIIIN